MNIVRSIVVSLLAGTTAPAIAAAEDGGASMYRFPDISNDEIVFAYGNDLWRVPVEGGTALPLASPTWTLFARSIMEVDEHLGRDFKTFEAAPQDVRSTPGRLGPDYFL